MQVIHGADAIRTPPLRPVVTVGNFDGIHRGHQAILATVVERAHALEGQAMVYTFEPHPRKVLHPDRAPGLLLTLDQKLELLESHGVDAVVVQPFSREFARTTAEEFVRGILHEKVRPLEVYVGYDFHFGRDREGSMRMLTEMGPRLGFSVTIIPEVTVDEGDVNSTRIRELLGRGEVSRAAGMLGRPYVVRGRVARGEQRGRGLGFPTANLDPENEVLPAAGVYAGWLELIDEGEPRRGSRWPAVTNVGRRPTFQQLGTLVAEAHCIGFEGDLYGRRVDLSFVHHLREERRFDGEEALKAQIRADAEQAQRLLEAT